MYSLYTLRHMVKPHSRYLVAMLMISTRELGALRVYVLFRVKCCDSIGHSTLAGLVRLRWAAARVTQAAAARVTQAWLHIVWLQFSHIEPSICLRA